MKELFLITALLYSCTMLCGQTNHTHEHEGVVFEVGKAPNKPIALATRPYKTRETLSSFCTRDFFATSGTTDKWKVPATKEGSILTNIVPGEIFDLSKYNGGSFFEKIQRYKRSRIRIHLSPSPQGNKPDAWVERPKLSANIESNGVLPIWNNLKNEAINREVAVTSDFTKIVSKQQLKVELGGAIPTGIGKIKFSGAHETSTSSETYLYMLDLEDRLFTLQALGNKIEKNSFFEPGEFPNERHSRKDLAYVSSVQYGRRISVIIESDESLDELTNKAEVEFNGKGLVPDFNSAINNHKSNKENSLSYSIYILGGAGDYKVIPKKGGKSKLTDVLKHVAEIVNTPIAPKNAAPISFLLNSIRGDKPLIVSTYSPIESTKDKCNATWKVSLVKVMANEVKDGTGENALELYGSYTVKALKNDGSRLYEDGYEPIYQNQGTRGEVLINPAGKTTFAHESEYWKIRAKGSRSVSPTSYAAGGKKFSIPHDALQGAFRITVDANDSDKTSANDSIDGSSSRIDIDKLSDGKLVTIDVTGNRGNHLIFTFLFELE